MHTHRRPVFAIAALILTGLLNAGCSHQRVEAESSDRARGAELFAKNCQVCHSATPDAMRIGPALTGEGRKRTLAQITLAIEAPDPPMPKLYPGTLSEKDVLDIAAYVKTL
ncbi:MAG TPA: cytochrome c [Candidatus Acidoferrales bacterium]|nr:cytochrome c [Candidatus Acidoferrales bacterium]